MVAAIINVKIVTSGQPIPTAAGPARFRP